MRLFLAVSPDEPARVRIEAVHAEIERAAGGEVPLRWVAATVAHLTVHFLGDVEPARVAPLIASLAAAVPVDPFNLTLGPPEVSPRSGPPRVVWMPVTDGADRLTEVHHALGARITNAGLTIERRPFMPHLTIARVRDRDQRRARSLGGHLRDLRVGPVGWRVDHVTLFQSDLSGPTPKYAARHTIALAAGG